MIDKKSWNVIFIIAGLFVLITTLNLTSQEKMIVFDGQENNFEIELTSWDVQVEVGDTSTMSLEVENVGEFSGSMYVQCSILNDEDNTFLLTTQSLSLFPVVTNCVENEPFTQTAKVDLNAGESTVIDFTVAVPDTVGKKNKIFCDAYEQCFSEGVNPLSSDSLTKDITIVVNDGVESNNNYMREAEICDVTNDCFNNLFGFRVKCINNMCVDVEDALEVDTETQEDFKIDITDEAIGAWASQRKIFIIILGASLFLIGAIGAFSDGKGPKPTFI